MVPDFSFQQDWPIRYGNGASIAARVTLPLKSLYILKRPFRAFFLLVGLLL